MLISSLSAMQLILALSYFGLNNGARAAFSDPGPYASSMAAFSSTFNEPRIPTVATNFQSHFIQHKWDESLSHIVAGYWYNSAALGKVRVDETYDGAFGSSLFDYTNTSDGNVLNKQWILAPSVGSQPSCFVEHISQPGFPLVTANILTDAKATFGGVVNDQWLGYVQSWHLLYGSVSVTAYLDMNNTFVGFDFWGTERRTKVITRFFNIVVGEIDKQAFTSFPC